MLQNILKSLIAVVAGNLIYFFLLSPILPQRARHTMFQIDLGLVVDFWLCVAIYGIVDLFFRRSKTGAGHR